MNTVADEAHIFSGTKEVSEAHRFDEAALAAWMNEHVEGYQGPLEVRQFKGGQSNPTYKLITPAKAYVMRRKPPGKLRPRIPRAQRPLPDRFSGRAALRAMRGRRGDRNHVLRDGHG